MSSNHDAHAGDAGEHAAHGPAVEADASPVDANRPTPLSAFIWPALIALLVLILVWNPVTSVFTPNRGGYNANGQPTPTLAPPAGAGTAAPIEATLAVSTPVTGNAQTVIPQPTSALTAVPTNVAGGGLVTLTPAATDTVAPPSATAALPPATAPAAGATMPASATPVAAPAVPTTAAPAGANTPAAPVPTTAVPAPAAAPSETPAPPAGTATPAAPAAAVPPAIVAASGRTPKLVAVAGKTFPVAISSTTAPVWVFSKDPAVANWISGTDVNYVLGISYSPANAALFAHVHAADTIRLTGTDGAVVPFVVDEVRRIAPADTKPLAQDHPAITLLLLEDPAPDRALIQGHCTDALTC